MHLFQASFLANQLLFSKACCVQPLTLTCIKADTVHALFTDHLLWLPAARNESRFRSTRASLPIGRLNVIHWTGGNFINLNGVHNSIGEMGSTG